MSTPLSPTRKTIIFLYLAMLVFLTINSFNKTPPPPPQPIRLQADEKKSVLPKTPVISLINDSENPVIIDTCRDIEVNINGIAKQKLPSELCRTIEISAKTTLPLFGNTQEDILLFQTKFANVSQAELRFSYTQTDTNITSEANVIIKKAGWMRLLFRTLFYDPVYNLFAGLILVAPGYELGWAIIAITLIIRLALLAPQQKTLVSQRKMQLIQPKIKAIQEAHKGDQATIGMKMMELYKKEGVNPLGSCLPILIQIPILIVLYQVILNISNPANFAHLYTLPWLQGFKTTVIDTHFFGLFLEKSGGMVGVILGVATGALQFGQMWLAQKKNVPATTEVVKKDPNVPDMQQMQKMMIYIFPAMAAIFAFQFPAGVGLYWLIGTAFMIVQQYFANKQTEEKKIVIRDAKGNTL